MVGFRVEAFLGFRRFRGLLGGLATGVINMVALLRSSSSPI